MQEFTPIEYLKIDVASNFGLDKESWNNRLTWFEANEPVLEQMNTHAEEPALYYAGVKAYRAAMLGKDIAYPISLDATASGAQLLAVLIGCHKSAKLCNVIDTGSREDFYTNIYDSMVDSIGSTAKIDRKDTKRAIMTSLYSSQAVPKEVFGEGELLETFFKTMDEEAPGVWRLNEGLQGLWQSDALEHSWVLPDNFHVHVKVMDTQVDTFTFLERPYDVRTKVNKPTDSGRSLVANLTHSVDGLVVREMTARCDYNLSQVVTAMELCLGAIKQTHTPSQLGTSTKNVTMVKTLAKHFEETGFLSARIIDYIDEASIHYAPQGPLWNLLESLPKKPFNILSIHDCFKVHPNYGNDLRKQYNQILHEIAKSSLLVSLASQIAGEQVDVRKFGDLTNSGIREANYALS